jgi:two-component system sensor histidine kinase CpxA
VRSLFARVLAWFLATLAITGAGFWLTSLLAISGAQPQQMPFQIFLAAELRLARDAFERGGRDALSAEFERVRRAVPRMKAILTGADGIDLLSGDDYSDLVDRARRRPRSPIFRDDSIYLARPDPSGRYWLLVGMPRRTMLGWILQANHLWVGLVAVLLCYFLARHLTAPLRQLQAAVERFGRGDFSARTASTRADELGDLARTFDRMADRIQSQVESERRLLGDISHELRSPLARLGVAVELARTGEDRDAALDRVQKEADRLNELVGQLLEMHRSPAAMSPLRLDVLLRQVAEEASLEAQAKGCRIRFEGPPEVTIRGDAELLRRAVENMLRNAIRYSPDDSLVELTLTVGGTARICVRDRGPGVPPEAVPRLFDPFYRVGTDRDRRSGGVGLGLAIARRAVEAHGGTIHAHNREPGLEVTIELPVL